MLLFIELKLNDNSNPSPYTSSVPIEIEESNEKIFINEEDHTATTELLAETDIQIIIFSNSNVDKKISLSTNQLI